MTEKELIERAVSLEMQCLQIGDNLPLHNFSTTRINALKEMILRNGLRIEIGARGLRAESLSRYLRICQDLGAPLLRFVIDSPGYQPPADEVTGLLRDFLPALEKAKITLGIENHDRFKAKELALIMEALGSDSVGICLDCVNSIGAGEGLEYVADLLSPYTVNLHIKDFTIERLPHQMGFTVSGAPAGKGMTNIPLLMEYLANYGRCQSAVLEQWVPWQNSLDETIQKEKEWAEEGILYLKQHLCQQ